MDDIARTPISTFGSRKWSWSKAILLGICLIANYIGIFALFRRINRQRIQIFMLHSVVDDTKESCWKPIRGYHSIVTLEACIRRLRKNHVFGTIDDVHRAISGKQERQSNMVVFTLDDGYKNNVSEALPIFEKYDVPVAIYVTSGAVESQKPFWFDRLDFALQHRQAASDHIETANLSCNIDYTSRDSLAEDFQELRAALKSEYESDTEMRSDIMRITRFLEDGCETTLADNYDGDMWSELLTVREISELAKNPLVTIGAHSVNHARLGKVSDQDVRDEVVGCKKSLEAWTKQPVLHFAYPDGNFSNKAKEEIASAGFQTAVTTDAGLVDVVSADALELRRSHLPFAVQPIELLAITSGFHDWMIAKKHTIGSMFGIRRWRKKAS